MNCGCTKDLGCFAPGQLIEFGFSNPCPDPADFIFEIWSNGAFLTITETFDPGDPIILPMEFNENSETIIKIKLPECMAGAGVHYATSPDGACSFSIHGIVPQCI